MKEKWCWLTEPPLYENHDRRRKRLEVSNRRKQLDAIYIRDGAVCQLCGKHVEREDASRDHIKRLVQCTKAEARSLSNMRLAHKDCNNDRRHYDEVLVELEVAPLVIRNKSGRRRLSQKIGDWFPEIPEAYYHGSTE